MSYMLQHLRNGWQVDQAILSEEDRVVIIRFGHDWDPTCMVGIRIVLYCIWSFIKCLELTALAFQKCSQCEVLREQKKAVRWEIFSYALAL